MAIAAIVLLAVATFGYHMRSANEPVESSVRGDANRPHSAADESSNPCQNDTPGHEEQATVEDRALFRHLSEQGGQLVDQNRVVGCDKLIEQLKQAKCELKLPAAKPIANNPVEIFKKAKDGVVVIGRLYKCKKCTKWHAATASGFVITATGAIVTNYHVVDDASKRTLVVMTADRRVFPVQQVLAASRENDLAILKVDAENLTPLPIAPSDDSADVGSPVSVISHPANRFYCYTSGVVSRRARIRDKGAEIDALFITADYARGSSGAPVLNDRGQVVGIVKSTDSIYYSVKDGQQQNLQMVFKICILSKSLHGLITTGSP